MSVTYPDKNLKGHGGLFRQSRYNVIRFFCVRYEQMVVGVLTLELFLAEASCLKSKRRILKSLLDKMKSRFNVAVAEVDLQDRWQHSTVGVTCVTNEASHAHQMMSSVVRFVENTGTVEILKIQTELL